MPSPTPSYWPSAATSYCAMFCLAQRNAVGLTAPQLMNRGRAMDGMPRRVSCGGRCRLTLRAPRVATPPNGTLWEMAATSPAVAVPWPLSLKSWPPTPLGPPVVLPPKRLPVTCNCSVGSPWLLSTLLMLANTNWERAFLARRRRLEAQTCAARQRRTLKTSAGHSSRYRALVVWTRCR